MKNMSGKRCIGFIEDSHKCKFGFDQKHFSICSGKISSGEKNNIPQCCNEDICAQYYNKTGGRPDERHL